MMVQDVLQYFAANCSQGNQAVIITSIAFLKHRCYICDQICKNQTSSYQMTKHTFRHQSPAAEATKLKIHVYAIVNDSVVCFS